MTCKAYKALSYDAFILTKSSGISELEPRSLRGLHKQKLTEAPGAKTRAPKFDRKKTDFNVEVRGIISLTLNPKPMSPVQQPLYRSCLHR